MKEIRVFDNFLPDPDACRAAALALEYRTLEFPEATFHGIATPTPAELPDRIAAQFPGLVPMLSFFRRSPAGQVEPHFIHTDADMGEWTALLYLNPDPPPGDGTAFWMHRETRTIESAVPHERTAEGRTAGPWRLRKLVTARFNRLLLFPATYFHSRALFNNWSEAGDDRLIQVVFGKGDPL